MRKFFFYVTWILFAGLRTIAQTPDELSSQSKEFEKEGNIEKAIAFAQQAADADKSNWRSSWELGELILNKSERKGDALAPFTAARNRGYTKPIVYHKLAMCHFHLEQYDTAIRLLNHSIAENKRIFEQAKAVNNISEASHAGFQIGDSYVWLTKIFNALEDYQSYYDAARQVQLYDPKSRWNTQVLEGSARARMNDRITNGDFVAALAFGREELDIAKHASPNQSHSQQETFLELLENRAKLGTITPAYTHKILAVYFNNFEATYPWKGTQASHKRKMTDHEKHVAIIDQKIMTMTVESLSNGQLSLSWDSVNIDEPIRDVKTYEANDMVEPLWPPNQEFVEVFKNRYQDFDTFFMVWNGPTKEAIGGAGSMLPGYPQRGTVRIHPDHGTVIWIHEFFHSLETKTGISPPHGFREADRKHFPEWKGETNNELDYYRWHFTTKFNDFGFANLKFR
jgi:tetratricopeptide (TPR) repeat protein